MTTYSSVQPNIVLKPTLARRPNNMKKPNNIKGVKEEELVK